MTQKFPKINFIGNKEKIASWIVSHFPNDAETIFDAFSGGGSISYFSKKNGLEVFSNDILKINYHIAKGLVENNNVQLNDNDIDIIFSGAPIEGFMFKNYSNVYFFENECAELDLYRLNIEKFDNEYKKSLALILLRRAMIRKMPYSRFNIKWEKVVQLRDEEYSYEKYKRRRGYHNESFKSHFLNNLSDYNSAVFSNNKNNLAFNEDIFDIIGKISADVIYLDPPYTGTMNNYFGFYGMLDEYITGIKQQPFENNFIDKSSSLQIFESLFAQLSNFKYWYLSYNNTSYPSKTQLLEMLQKYSDDIKVLEIPHVYKITGKDKKSSNMEFLFIIKNKNYDKNTSNAGRHKIREGTNICI
jgi:adenine-specific DNA-methyltransferase